VAPVFRRIRHIHFVAIGGIGMSGIAEILLNHGFRVSGSDLQASANTDRLARLGATVHIGHRSEQIEGADVVVYSSAVTEANPELKAARERHLPVIRRADMLAELMRLKDGIAVAGSHGKTTTTSLVAGVLESGGLDPTVILGGRVLTTGDNAILGGGRFLVAEADESDGSFLRLTPVVAVVTNVDLEHVDHYPDLDALREAFGSFLERVPFYGTCVLCVDDPEVRALAPRLDRRVLTYGLSPQAAVRGVPLPRSADLPAGRQQADVLFENEPLGRLDLGLRGVHNLRNALAAAAVGIDLEIPFAHIAAGLAGCCGVSRRCEDRGRPGGVQVLDDYGHHPTEIVATLAVARSYGERVVVLFQPHRYTRTARFRREFADALAAADVVGLLPVYGASEEPLPGVDSESVAVCLRERATGPVEVIDGPASVPAWLDEHARPGDVLLVLGAGDIGRLVDPICRHLERRERE
jgi:UDP-N-acetylmuramate--alanine ligase